MKCVNPSPTFWKSITRRMAPWILLVGLAQLCNAQTDAPHVALLLNSGVENPAFDLTDDQAHQIASAIGSLDMTQDPQWTSLGWRGFQVENLTPTISLVVVFDGVIAITDTDKGSEPYFYYDTNYSVQQYLCNLASENGQMPAGASCLPGTTDPVELKQQLVEVPAVSPWPVSGSEPPYDPAAWNTNAQPKTIQKRNNCYNYSTSTKNGTYGQPGQGAGAKWTVISCANVGAAAKKDGLVPIACNKACPAAKSYKVALVIDNTGGIGLSKDFHWYEQNDKIDGNVGYFSHKPGEGRATKLDTSGNLISTPDKADRRRLDMGSPHKLQAGYATFCEPCYCVDPSNVTIKGLYPKY